MTITLPAPVSRLASGAAALGVAHKRATLAAVIVGIESYRREHTGKSPKQADLADALGIPVGTIKPYAAAIFSTGDAAVANRAAHATTPSVEEMVATLTDVVLADRKQTAEATAREVTTTLAATLDSLAAVVASYKPSASASKSPAAAKGSDDVPDESPASPRDDVADALAVVRALAEDKDRSVESLRTLLNGLTTITDNLRTRVKRGTGVAA